MELTQLQPYQDLRLEEEFQSCVWFQPSLAPARPPNAAPAGPRRPSALEDKVQHLLPTVTAAGMASSMALLVRKTRVPELLLQRPLHTMSVATTPMAAHVPSAHNSHHSRSLPHHYQHRHHRHHHHNAAPAAVAMPSMRYSATISDVWDTAQHLQDKLSLDSAVQVKHLVYLLSIFLYSD